MIYLLRLSPYNEDVLWEYATNEEEIKLIAKKYMEEYLLAPDEQIQSVNVDYQNMQVRAYSDNDDDSCIKTFYLKKLERVAYRQGFSYPQ